MKTVRVQLPRLHIDVDRVVGIDAGNKSSGFAIIEPISLDILELGDAPNEELLERFGVWGLDRCAVALEMMHNQGKRVGRDVFEACVWIGRYQERARECRMVCELILRKTASSHVADQFAGDSGVKRALVSAYGGTAAAVGTKASPGPMYGASSHALAALAVARTFAQTRLVGVEA